EDAEGERACQIHLAGPALAIGQKNDVHALAAYEPDFPVLLGRQRGLRAVPPGRVSPCSAWKTLYDAGNPAVMAPRFRPVVLRPRLSAGVAHFSKSNIPTKGRRGQH